MTELIDQLKQTVVVISGLKDSILEMCDDMDRAADVLDKEKIRLAIIETENILSDAETIYNELLNKISEYDGRV
jgi:hypothetical protein